MQRILPADRQWPLHGLASSRAIEAEALGLPGLPPAALMQCAGKAVARLALALAPHARQAWVLAGPGNNGGDGLEAARCLHLQGRPVTVSFLGDAGHLPPDAALAWRRAHEAGVQIQAFAQGVAPPLGADDIAIDAMLGLGGRRPIIGSMAEAVTALNALPCPVLAVDLPSGLEGDGGQPTGPHVVRATHTLALLTLKPGLFTGTGRDLAGSVWLDELGITVRQAPDAWLAGPSAATARRHAQHKGSFGDLLVVGGAPGMAGASWLAARAAHAAGAGRVWVVPLDPDAQRLDPIRPELMWHTGVGEVDEAVWSSATVVCGCGGGQAVVEVLPALLAAVPRLVLDADALNAVAGSPALQRSLGERAARAQASVLTPHPLEAARLLGTDTAKVQADRLGAARALSQRFSAVVVLKGSGSVIAGPGHLPCLSTSGDASLASPGTGDVLAGWLGGSWSALLANHGEAPGSMAFRAACSAVWQHGAAADSAGLRVMRAADLIDRLARTPAAPAP